VFQTALRRLQADAERTVFVGDDLTADIGGARAAGMKTIHITAARSAGADSGNCACGPHAQRLGAVPSLAEQLVPSGRTAHHAW
jgi:FMN phosphatase YigB (HAD superfamily)